jgi:hypothetical protein
MWHHPKYYEELRKKRKELEASLDPETRSNKPQAASVKQQASSNKPATNCRSDDMSQES